MQSLLSLPLIDDTFVCHLLMFLGDNHTPLPHLRKDRNIQILHCYPMYFLSSGSGKLIHWIDTDRIRLSTAHIKKRSSSCDGNVLAPNFIAKLK